VVLSRFTSGRLVRFLREAQRKKEREQGEGCAKEKERGEIQEVNHVHANSRSDDGSEIISSVKITDALRPMSLWANVDDHDDRGRIKESCTDSLEYSYNEKKPKRGSYDITEGSQYVNKSSCEQELPLGNPGKSSSHRRSQNDG
jgi:hypothetical protein